MKKKNKHFNFQFKACRNHQKKGNIHFNVDFMPLYDINNSRIIDKFTIGLYLMCQQINISIKNTATHYSNLKVIFLSTYF